MAGSGIASRLGEDGDDVVDETDRSMVGERSGIRWFGGLFGSEAKSEPADADAYEQQYRHKMTERPRLGLCMHRENQGGMKVGAVFGASTPTLL
jgi:hypothetical protein